MREDPPVLGDERDAAPRAAVGRLGRQVRPVEADSAADPWPGIHQGLEQRRLARAVAAEQRDAFAGADGERDPVEDVAVAIEGIETRDLKHDGLRGRDRSP